MKTIKLLFLVFLITLSLCACTDNNENPVLTEPIKNKININSIKGIACSAADKKNSVFNVAASVDLKSGDPIIQGDGITFSDSSLIITDGGKYTLSGEMNDCRIIIDADKSDVEIEFKNVKITSSLENIIYVKSANSVNLVFDENNFLKNGSEVIEDDGYAVGNSCIYSNSPLALYGKCEISSKTTAIEGKEKICLDDCDIRINSKINGIKSEKNIIISESSLFVYSKKDSIVSASEKIPDSDKSNNYISVYDSVIEIESDQNGIYAENYVTVNDGRYSFKCGNINLENYYLLSSVKGIKAGNDISLVNADFNIQCIDDGLCAGRSIYIGSGKYYINTRDDAVHCDYALKIDGGNIDIVDSYNGLEANIIRINGGNISIYSTNDGINIAGGNDKSGFVGKGFNNKYDIFENAYLKISSGIINVYSAGSTIDAYGDIFIDGGKVFLCGYSDNTVLFDYNGEFQINGGQLLATGSNYMIQAPTSAKQEIVYFSTKNRFFEGTNIELRTDSINVVFLAGKCSESIVFSSDNLSVGDKCIIKCDVKIKENIKSNFYLNINTQDGYELCSFNLKNNITSFGPIGQGGSLITKKIGDFGAVTYFDSKGQLVK